MANVLTYHVNGPAGIATEPAGLGSAMPWLGYAVDGVDIALVFKDEDVEVDFYGPGVPGDVQDFLQEATIRFRLVCYDQTVVSSLMTRNGLGTFDSSSEPGVMPSSGGLINQSSTTAAGPLMQLYIDSPVEGIPFFFPTAYVTRQLPIRRGTRKSVWDFEFRALPWFPSATLVGTTLGFILYTNTIPATAPVGYLPVPHVLR